MARDGISRRYFFYGSLLAGAVPLAGFGSEPSLKMLGYKSPNEKLNIASVGAGGKATSDIDACAETENIVSLCDVDEKRAAEIYGKFPNVPKFKDYRVMLDKQGNGIDAVIVTIPDHMHAAAALDAMQRGKHVYVQKPLAHSVWECRELQKAANKFNVATQMGNQGYSNEGTRQCAEMIWSGVIGNVTEVHAWTNRPAWPQGIATLPQPTPPVPSYLDWNLWLGVAQERPYSEDYLPFVWRGFYDFGSGALGDMACHILGAPNMALRLGAPTAIECVSQEGKSDYYYPAKSVLKFEFPARGDMPPVTVYWYDAMREDQPTFAAAPKDQILGDLPRSRWGDQKWDIEPRERQEIGHVFNEGYFTPTNTPPPPPRRRHVSQQPMDAHEKELAKWMALISQGTNGSLFVGDKGMITSGTYGEWTRLIPVEKMRDYQFPPEVLTRSPGHYRDWIRACKGGDPACSNFNVAAPFTEWITLGAIATRLNTRLEWDAANMKITNNKEADDMLKPKFRKGYDLSV